MIHFPTIYTRLYSDACVLTLVLIVGFLQEGLLQATYLLRSGLKTTWRQEKLETNQVACPALEHEPSDVDAPPKGKFAYILVFQLQLCIHWFILMHMPLPTGH